MDLVEMQVDENGTSICKLMDYKKFLYNKSKKSKNKVHKVDTKEIRISPNTQLNDLQVKAKKIDKLISKGDKVKITIVYKGRQSLHMENCKEKMESLIGLITENYIISSKIKRENNRVSAILEAIK